MPVFTTAHGQGAPSAQEIPILARRPMLDRQLRTVGYELRAADGSGSQWQGELLSDAYPAYLSVSRGRLLQNPALPPQPGGVIVRVGDEGPADAALLGALRNLRAQGRAVVLDDVFYRPALESLIELADIVKLHVDGARHQQALADLDRLRRPNLKLLAQGVDSEDAFTVYRDAGFDLFEGLFYEHPRMNSGLPLPAVHAGALGTLAELESRGADLDALDAIIRRDVGLSYRLLRYVNSAFVGLPRTLGSVREALTMLGTRAVRQWAVALVLSGLEQRPHALLSSALVRARTCETLVKAYDAESADQGFTAGLFSLLDAMLERPMPEILAALPLTVEVKAAILGHDGPLGHALEKAIAYGRGEFDAPSLAGHARMALAIAYSDAVQWVDGLL